jgi:D-glycero-D-manno-heptose 1,7-bisphosphate phosphatase
MRKAFFFDRDGVLNKSIVKLGKPYSPNSFDELVITDGAKEIIKYIKNKNYLTIVVTNQPDVKRKKTSRNFVEKINSFLKKKLLFDDLFVCYDDNDFSFFRKPKPGMIFQAQKKWNIDLTKSFIIGDRNKDIMAGIKAGIKTIFIDNNYLERKPTFTHYKIKCLKELKKIIL